MSNLFNTDNVSDLPSDVVSQKPVYREKGEWSETKKRINSLLRQAGGFVTAYEIVVAYYRQHKEVIDKKQVYMFASQLIKEGHAKRRNAGEYKAA